MRERHVPHQILATQIAEDDMGNQPDGGVLHIHHEDGEKAEMAAIYFTQSEWEEIKAIWRTYYPDTTLQRALVDGFWKYGELSK